MIKIVFLRHGESVWNKENKFTGWSDVDLTPHGISQAHNAGKELSQNGFVFDCIHTSRLIRASETAYIVREEMQKQNPAHDIHMFHTWRLNERHYGALEGLNKHEMVQKYGEKQVHIWRRSWDVMPPLLKRTDKRWQGNNAKYHDLREEEIPLGESAALCSSRVLPFWYDVIIPQLRSGFNVLVVASGNSLRCIVKVLDQISKEDIPNLNIPTGVPLVYELDETNNFRPIKHYYLGNQEEIQKQIEAIKNQGH